MKSFSQLDKQLIWHPYTQHSIEDDPLVIKRAKNASLFTETDFQILDLISSWWTTTHGHSHSELNNALKEQVANLEHVMFAGFTHPQAINLSKSLIESTPKNLKKVFFSDNGSTSIEVAIKMCLQFWKNKGSKEKNKFLVFDGGYHGDTVGAMSISKGSGFFNNYRDLLFGVCILPFPETWLCDEKRREKEDQSLVQIKKVIRENKNELCGLIIEPLLQGAGGMRMCSSSFLKKVTDIAHENNILVVYDEVAVGFGRLGELFACKKTETNPDVLCLSKGLTAGYMPLAVTLCTNKIYDQFLSEDLAKTLLHGHTFTANPLACAVANKSLQLFQEEKTLGKIERINSKHLEFIKDLKASKKTLKERVAGSILAFNIKQPNNHYKNNGSEELRRFFIKKGLNIRPIGSCVYLMPPYCITDRELDKTYNTLLEKFE